MENLTALLTGNLYLTIGVVVLLILLLCFFYYKKESKIVREIMINAILSAEKNFNSGEGQKKLEYAVTVIKSKLPVILKPIFTKFVLVTCIEKLLNSVSNIWDLDTSVDIKGNETTISGNAERKDNVDSLNVEIKKK